MDQQPASPQQTPDSPHAPVQAMSAMPATPPDATAATGHVPPSWPGAFGILKNSKDAVLVNIVPIAIFFLINLIIIFVMSYFFGGERPRVELPQAVGLLLNMVVFAVACYLAAGITIASLDGIDNKKTSLGAVASRSFSFFFSYLMLSLLLGLILVLSIFAFLIPFFFILPRVFLASYYLIDRKLGILEALQMSWNSSRGNVGKIYGVLGVTFLFCLLVPLVVGLVFLTVYFAALPMLSRFIANRAANTPVA